MLLLHVMVSPAVRWHWEGRPNRNTRVYKFPFFLPYLKGWSYCVVCFTGL